MDKQKLEQHKQALVSELNKVVQKIDDYWLLDIAYDSWPFKDLIIKRDAIKREIDVVNKAIEDIEKSTLSI